MNKALKIIIPIVMVLAIAGLVTGNYFSERVVDNDISTIGNTPGNLYNGGVFCENGDKIFFSNPSDEGCLYSMNKDLTGIKKLSENVVSYINSAGNFIYYTKNNGSSSTNASVVFRGEIYGVVRCKLNGKSSKTLYSGYSSDLSLTGNTLLFTNTEDGADVTSTISIKGEDKAIINRQKISVFSVANGKGFYSSTVDNHNINYIDAATGLISEYYEGNTYMASIYNNKLYFIDLSDDYSLVCVDMLSGTQNTITSDHVVNYNVYENTVYYQIEEPVHALMKINVDGTGRLQLMEGDFSSISCTSSYSFFRKYDTNDIYYTETETGSVLELLNL